MIQPRDYEIRINETPEGVVVSVVHRPTGYRRSRVAAPARSIGDTRNALVAELESLLYAPDDIRIDLGCSPKGDWLRVVHLPSGIERSAMRRDCTQRDLLDAVLEELIAKTSPQ